MLSEHLALIFWTNTVSAKTCPAPQCLQCSQNSNDSHLKRTQLETHQVFCKHLFKTNDKKFNNTVFNNLCFILFLFLQITICQWPILIKL